MTDYYIDPELGSDYNEGYSWGTALRSFYGLKVLDTYLSPGDRVKIAKSTVKTNVSASVGGLLATAPITNATYLGLGPAGSWRRALGGLSGTWVASQTYTSFVGVPASVTFTSPTVISTQSIKLCYTAVPAGSVNHSAFRVLMMQVRASTPYTGAGDGDIPPGTFEVRLCSDALGNTALVTIPINAYIRNISTAYSTFWHESASPFPTNVASISIWRTTSSLTRDSVVWGLEFYRCTFFRGWADTEPAGPCAVTIPHSTDVVDSSVRLPWGFKSIAKGYGLLEPVECSIARGDSESGNVPCAYPINALSPSSSSLQTQIKPYVFQDIICIGTDKWIAMTGTNAAYDLWTNNGGNLGNPIVVEGGWNTATDTVDGVTVFSGGRDTCVLHAHFLDLQHKPHITIKNVSALGGFASIVVNPGTGLTLVNCQFPDKAPPVTGLNFEIDCNFIDCRSSRTGAYNLGVLGALTLTNTVLALSHHPITTGANIEVASLYATGSVLHDDFGDIQKMTLSVIGDAYIAGVVLDGAYMWAIDNTSAYGKVLTIANTYAEPTAVPRATNLGSEGGDAPERCLLRHGVSSAWGKVIYDGCSFLNLGYFVPLDAPSLNEELHFHNCSNPAYGGPLGTMPIYTAGSVHYSGTTVPLYLLNADCLHFDPYISGLTPTVLATASTIFIHSELPTPAYIDTSHNVVGAAVYNYSVANDYSANSGRFHRARGVFGFSSSDKAVTAEWSSAWPWGWKNNTSQLCLRPKGVDIGKSSTVMYLAYTYNLYLMAKSAYVNAGDTVPLSLGPLGTYMLDGGRTYKVSFGIVPHVKYVPPVYDTPDDLAVRITEQSAATDREIALLITLVSLDCFGSGYTVLKKVYPTMDSLSGSGQFAWRREEILFDTVAAGEVSVFIMAACAVTAFYGHAECGCMIDSLVIER